MSIFKNPVGRPPKDLKKKRIITVIVIALVVLLGGTIATINILGINMSDLMGNSVSIKRYTGNELTTYVGTKGMYVNSSGNGMVDEHKKGTLTTYKRKGNFTTAQIIKPPKKSGYTLKGYIVYSPAKHMWYMENGKWSKWHTGGGEATWKNVKIFKPNIAKSVIPRVNNLELYPIFVQKYKIKYSCDEGSGTIPEKTFIYGADTFGDKQYISSKKCTLSGYKHNGWNVNRTTYNKDLGDESYRTAKPGQTITLYANWRGNYCDAADVQKHLKASKTKGYTLCVYQNSGKAPYTYTYLGYKKSSVFIDGGHVMDDIFISKSNLKKRHARGNGEWVATEQGEVLGDKWYDGDFTMNSPSTSKLYNNKCPDIVSIVHEGDQELLISSKSRLKDWKNAVGAASTWHDYQYIGKCSN